MCERVLKKKDDQKLREKGFDLEIESSAKENKEIGDV